MAKSTLIDELHLTVLVPAGLPRVNQDAVARTLKSQRFQARLRDALRKFLSAYPSLKSVKFTISR